MGDAEATHGTHEFFALQSRLFKELRSGRFAREVSWSGGLRIDPGPELFDRVRAYAARARPWLVAELDRLYDGMAPTVDPATWMETYPGRPPAEREALRDRAWQAANLLLDNDSDA